MVFKVKNILVSLLLLGFGLLGWKYYFHFFDKTTPQIQLFGIKNDGYYCGNIQCTLSSNKVGAMSIWLDEKPLTKKFNISKPNQEHSFTIPTRTLPNGKHDVKVVLADNTYNKNKKTELIHFYVDNTPLQVAFVKPDTEFKVFQGRTLHLQFQVNKKIKEAKVQALSKTYDCFPESKNSSIYEAFIPTQCEENPNEYLLSVDITDYVGNTFTLENKFQVVKFPFKKTILQIKKEKIKEEKEAGTKQEELEQTVEQIIAQSPKEKLWQGTFCAPIEIIRTTCEFGTIRISQEKGKYYHRAVDIINEPKSVVWAAQDGIVRIKSRYAQSGNTVIIDHGFGIITRYYHLDEFANIKVGDMIRKGNPVGTIGKTGYSTGFHLHWELQVNNVHVDPMQWVSATF